MRYLGVLPVHHLHRGRLFVHMEVQDLGDTTKMPCGESLGVGESIAVDGESLCVGKSRVPSAT